MIPLEKRHSIALKKFLASDQELQTRLNNINSTVADNLGIPLEEYRQQKLAEAFNHYCKINGLDTSKLIIDLCANNEHEKTEMHLQRAKKIAENLG